MKKITSEWLEYLWYGSIFLGSGGGGKSSSLLSEISKLLQDNSIPLLALEELPEEEFFCGIAFMGAPELFEENFLFGIEVFTLIGELEKQTKLKFSGISIIEGAGVNIFYPLLAAAKLRLPIIDGDAMGRAFPELQMTTYHLENLSPTPLVLVDGNYDIHLFSENKDTFLLEVESRHIISRQGGIGYIAGFPYPGKILKKVLLPGTLSFAKEIGECFVKAKNYPHLLELLIETTSNSFYGPVIEIFRGYLTDISGQETAKWKVATLSSSNGESFQLLFQNENLIGFKNGKIVATVPDLISIIDLKTLKPLNNNELYEGQEIAILAMPAPLKLRINKALDVVGPQCFGYRALYVPLEKLHWNYYYEREVFL
ncbi:DUF917 domain-containing protein [Caldanaerobacter subterraneus]|uniref:DUF917 domain-containing protein n=1 Tax=Caldanaerobacter subterraneus TaxID=911092 RepID=A0A7Y2L806_9THEO|nr:DUF917 domain-containing protein [Caldanaerobacter subterraneus]NNG66091.1 DUF917 domain-containing protein [Caldanaerobacter subterraneus]